MLVKPQRSHNTCMFIRRWQKKKIHGSVQCLIFNTVCSFLLIFLAFMNTHCIEHFASKNYNSTSITLLNSSPQEKHK